jgi:hypothetical protein
MKRPGIIIAITALLAAVSCGSSAGIDGEYVCTKNYTEAMVGKAVLDLKKDGKAALLPLNSEGTYKVEGDKVEIELEQFNLSFTIDGNKLVSKDGAVVYEKK